MTMLRHLYLLLIFASFTATHNTLGTGFSMDQVRAATSIYCSTIELLCKATPILAALKHYRNIQQDSKKIIASNAPEKIISFITPIANKRNIKNIKVITNNDHMDYTAKSHQNAIILHSTAAKELENLLSKKELTQEEQEILYDHIAAIYHELTHIQNDDSRYNHIYENIIGVLVSIIITTPISRVLTKKFPIRTNDFMTHNAFRIVQALAGLGITRYVMDSNFYSKYAELRADDGIPNKKELLKNQFEYYMQKHNNSLEAIDEIKRSPWKKVRNLYGLALSIPQIFVFKIIPKKFFNIPFVMNLVYFARLTHPCDLQRALRFKKRIDKIDQQLSEQNKT